MMMEHGTLRLHPRQLAWAICTSPVFCFLSIQHFSCSVHWVRVTDGGSFNQYYRAGDFNGIDTITMKVTDPNGLGAIRGLQIVVQAVNDPPYIDGPSVADLSRSPMLDISNGSVSSVPLPVINVGDPDEFDVRSKHMFPSLSFTCRMSLKLQ